MEICSATWNPEDRILELDEILQGASAASVEKQFVKYVIGNIEPTGWRAIWRSDNNTRRPSSNNLKQPMDFLVDVIHVSQEKLEAHVIIRGLVGEDANGKPTDSMNHEAIAPLCELYPIALQENTTIDIEMTTEVIDQMRFFFKNIWQPWDFFEELCCFDKLLITKRMKIYQDIQNGVLSRTISSEMDAITARGRETADEINILETKTGISTEVEIDQRDLVQLMKLNKEMDQLRMRYEALRDPALREFSIYQEQLERKDILASCRTEEPASILLVASSVILEKYIACMARLPEILKDFSLNLNEQRVKTFPSLQMALDSAQPGDTLALLPGSHILKNLGCLANGGIICGLGEGVELVGCLATGDVLLDLYLDEKPFSLHSITLKPLQDQIAVSLHKGQMNVKECSFDGGSIGLSVLTGSECRLERSKLLNQSLFGIEGTSDAKVILKNVSIEKCGESAMKLTDKAKVVMNGELLISDCPIGVTLPGIEDDSGVPPVSENNEAISRFMSTGEGRISFVNTRRKYVFGGL